MNDEILPHLENAKDRIVRMEESLQGVSTENKEFFDIRIEKLRRLTKASGRILPLLAKLIRP